MSRNLHARLTALETKGAVHPGILQILAQRRKEAGIIPSENEKLDIEQAMSELIKLMPN